MRQLATEHGILLATGLVLLLVLALLLGAPLRINQDAAIFLLIGDLVLQGHTPYVDYVENNFPLIHYLNTIPVAIAHLIGVNPILVFQFGLFALTIGIIAVIYYMHASSRDFELRRIGATFGLGIALATLLWVYHNHYGQRDHLFILLYLPGFALRSLRWNDRNLESRLSFLVGVLAAIGASLKPYFLVAPFIVEAYYALRVRTIRHLLAPECAGFVLFGALYALYFVVMPPEMRNNFIALVRDLQAGYSLYGNLGITNALRQLSVFFVIALVVFIYQPQPPRQTWAVLQALVILCLACALIYILQDRGFDYHLVPVITTSIVIISIAVFCPDIQHSSTFVMTRRRGILVVCLVGLFAALMGVHKTPPGNVPFPRDDLHDAILLHSNPGDSAIIVSSEAPDFRPLLETGRNLAPSYIPAYPVLFAYADIITGEEVYSSTANTPPSVRAYLQRLRTDLKVHEPDLFLVADKLHCIGCPAYFTLAKFLEGRGFLSESVSPEYQYMGIYDDVRLYQRVGPPSSLMDPIYFGDALKLVGWEIPQGVTASQCNMVILNTWWDAAINIDAFYSMTAVLTREGSGVANADGTIGGTETANWAAGQRRVDQRSLKIPCDLPPGDYPLLVGLYTVNVEQSALLPVTYEDGTPIGSYFYLTTITVTPGESP